MFHFHIIPCNTYIMKKLSFIALFLFSNILFLSCNNYASRKDDIIFTYQHHIVVDFKTKAIEVKMIKYKGVLELYKDEENKIYSAFNKSGISKLKGEVVVSDSLPTTPIIYSEFKIYENGSLKSSLLINEDYQKKQNSAEEQDQIANFKDVVKQVLDKNKSFNLAKDSLERYIKRHNLFNL